MKATTLLLGALATAFSLVCCGDSGTDPQTGPTIAVQVDVDPVDAAALQTVAAELEARHVSATLFAPPEIAAERELIHELFLRGFEVAVLTGADQGMAYVSQLDAFSEARQRVEGCLTCGAHGVPVVGFRPRGFVQNQDTYRALEELGFAYSAGFEARRIYAEGHQDDNLPYPLEGRQLAAVPVSAEAWGDGSIGLCAATCQEQGLSTAAWEGALMAALEKARAETGILVAVVHTGAVGPADSPYWISFLRFLDRARQYDARFLTTRELVREYVRY